MGIGMGMGMGKGMCVCVCVCVCGCRVLGVYPAGKVARRGFGLIFLGCCGMGVWCWEKAGGIYRCFGMGLAFFEI